MADFLASQAGGGARLRELLAGPDPLLAPGVFDALGARLVEAAGFDAVYMTGFGTAASLLGRPDVGLVTMSEMVDNARRISAACSIPVVADADTGYGNTIAVVRTVHEYERAGVAALHIEDQLAPKRCGHMDGKQLVPVEEMEAKVRAASAARSADGLLVIARTDARAVEGLPRALERAKRYRDAGADMLFVEAPTSRDEVETIAETLRDVPLLFNWAEGGKTPPVSYDDLKAMGYRLVIFPISLLLAATAAMRESLAAIKGAGSPAPILDRLPRFGEFLEFIGLADIDALDRRLAGG